MYLGVSKGELDVIDVGCDGELEELDTEVTPSS